MSSLCHHRVLSGVLCAIRQVLISYLFYTCAKLLRLCWTLCDPMDFSPPVSSIHGLLQAKILITGVGCHFLHQGIFLTQGLNTCLFFLPRWHASSLPLVPPGKLVFYLFIYLFFISWRLITLQYCSGFCHTLTWISHGFTCIPHPDPPSHLPLHLIPLG